MHKTVLLQETIDGLNLRVGVTVFDGTLGAGGHTAEIIRRFGSKVRVVGVDQDGDALKRVEEKLANLKANLILRQANYRDLDRVLDELQIEKIQGLILDLGLSSDQLEIAGRGFSFQKDEPLLMTFCDKPKRVIVTAEQVVNHWDEEVLADIIYGFGDERYARRIAKNIVAGRALAPIKTTSELVALIAEAVPASYRKGRVHFATKTFQALRMAVNDELGALSDGLKKGLERLSSGGRMAVISFHSGEDRLVKNFFRTEAQIGKALLINKKPLTPSDQEIKDNPRARSAKLRLIEKK